MQWLRKLKTALINQKKLKLSGEISVQCVSVILSVSVEFPRFTRCFAQSSKEHEDFYEWASKEKRPIKLNWIKT